MTVKSLDDANNPSSQYRGTVSFTSSDPSATLPSSYTFTASDAGTHVFSGVAFTNSGLQTITVQDTGASLSGTSNTVMVFGCDSGTINGTCTVSTSRTIPNGT